MTDEHLLNIQPGAIINGCYEVVKCLGAGSMGMVYACRHRELSDRLVAVKILFSEVASDAVAAARFRNEIFASYEVNHPNVVRAYEYFRDGDLIAFSMEYVGGGDLADRLGDERSISISDIIRFLRQMTAGVEAIHRAGIVHRDLKPENILLTESSDVKITDFGIARTGTGPRLTEHGGVVGTINYVSPEYLEVGQVDARSDIYGLGVLGYEMLTGESPFNGQSVLETITMRLRSDPESPTKIRPDCPVELADVILKALRRDPELRYQTAKEMLQDVEKIGLESSRPVQVPGWEIANKRVRNPSTLSDESAATLSDTFWRGGQETKGTQSARMFIDSPAATLDEVLRKKSDTSSTPKTDMDKIASSVLSDEEPPRRVDRYYQYQGVPQALEERSFFSKFFGFLVFPIFIIAGIFLGTVIAYLIDPSLITEFFKESFGSS